MLRQRSPRDARSGDNVGEHNRPVEIDLDEIDSALHVGTRNPWPRSRQRLRIVMRWPRSSSPTIRNCSNRAIVIGLHFRCRDRPLRSRPTSAAAAAAVGGRPAQTSGRESFSIGRGRQSADRSCCRADTPARSFSKRKPSTSPTPAARSRVLIRRESSDRRSRPEHGPVHQACDRAVRRCRVP
jgi:hypothetical protein